MIEKRQNKKKNDEEKDFSVHMIESSITVIPVKKERRRLSLSEKA